MGLLNFWKKGKQGEPKEPHITEFSVVIETTPLHQRDTDRDSEQSEFIGYDPQIGVPVFRRKKRES